MLETSYVEIRKDWNGYRDALLTVYSMLLDLPEWVIYPDPDFLVDVLNRQQ